MRETGKLTEILAENEHDRWCGMAGTALYHLNDERKERWSRLAETFYDDLSEEMKNKDRDQILSQIILFKEWLEVVADDDTSISDIFSWIEDEINYIKDKLESEGE